MEKETEVFKMPKATKITDRKSSITNASVNGIIPSIKPSEEEIKGALNTLGIDPENVRCAYCGEKMTQWDHFFPLIDNEKPTGHITEIHNLVPCCSTCNSSKGNTYWRNWFYSDAKNSPKKIVKDDNELKKKYDKLVVYENKYPRTVLNIEEIIGENECNDWNDYENMKQKLIEMMEEAQKLSNKIKEKLKKKYDKLNEQYEKFNKSKHYKSTLDNNQLDKLDTPLESQKEFFEKKWWWPVTGGWGYTLEDAVKIELDDEEKIENLEYQFMERRLYLEMKKNNRYGFLIESIKRSRETRENGNHYDKLTMEVTIFLKDKNIIECDMEGWFDVSKFVEGRNMASPEKGEPLTSSDKEE